MDLRIARDMRTQSITKQPEGPGVQPVRRLVVAAPKADDDAGGQYKEGVKDEKHHEQVPTLPKRVLAVHDVPGECGLCTVKCGVCRVTSDMACGLQ